MEPRVLISSARLPPEYTGAGLRAKRQAERLSQEVRFTFLCQDHGQSRDDIVTIRRIKEDGIMFPLFMMYSFAAVTLQLWAMSKDIDVIHMYSFSWFNRMVALSNVLFFKKRMVLEVTLYGSDDPKALLDISSKNRLMSWMTRPLLRRISTIIVPSKASKESAISTGFPEIGIWMRPHPVDEAKFASIPFNHRQEIRERLELPDGYLVLSIGKLCARKNQRFLVESFQFIDDKDIHLLLIGPEDPSYREELEAMSSRLQIHFMGRLQNIEEFMAACDLFVFASTSEGFPNVVAEAIVSGLPVVALSLEPINQYISPSLGRIIEQDQKKFAHTIVNYKKGKIKGERHYIRNEGKRLFGSSGIDKKYLQLYMELAR